MKVLDLSIAGVGGIVFTLSVQSLHAPVIGYAAIFGGVLALLAALRYAVRKIQD